MSDINVQRIIESGEIKSEVQTIKTPNLNGLNVSYATSNRWVGYIPISNVLGREYSNLELNLTNFTIPQMTCGSATVSFKNYSMEVPDKTIDAETKEITVEYIIDDKWQNYKSLYLFASQTGIINPISQETVDSPGVGNMIPIRIYLLDHFKNKIIQFIFHNAWIKVFGDLVCDYSNADEVHHSVTFVYSNFEISDSGLNT